MTADASMRSALAHRVGDIAAIERGTSGGLVLEEVPFPAQVDLRVGPADVALPRVPNTTLVVGDRTTLWLGPDEWLVTGAPGTAPAIIDDLTASFAGIRASILDVSANRAALDLSGPDVRDLLSKGCALDLHPSRWGPGTCAQTTLGRAQVILEQRGEGVTRVFIRPSFADYLVDWISAAS